MAAPAQDPAAAAPAQDAALCLLSCPGRSSAFSWDTARGALRENACFLPRWP